MSVKKVELFGVVCLTGVNVCVASAAPTITIDATSERRAVSPDMYGIFFEEINHAGEGGLYAEMVKNRDMEASIIPEGWHREGDTVYTPRGWQAHTAAPEDAGGRGRIWDTPVWFDSELPGWSFIAEGDAEGSMELGDAQPLNENTPHALKMTVTKLGNRCGIVNSGFWGMNIEKGEWYDITFYAYAEENRSVGLVFSFERPDGTLCARVTLPEIGRGARGQGQPGEAVSPWRKYQVCVQGWESGPDCRMVITPLEPVTMWLDVVSVFPRKTFKDRPNGMRPDVAQALADMKPGFLRFPGGCVVEGATIENRVQWKNSIGDISQRKGNFNLWGYYNSNGLGYHEYLQLAEDLGAEAMYVCNVGMSCQARQPAEVCDDEEIEFYIQDALDAIEYAVGPVTSEWGARRAANGRPEAFSLKYVEIGNEKNGPDYQERYRLFYEAIKAQFPDIITIADERMDDASLEIVDEHYYVGPARFFEMADYYDDADRNGPDIYVGEYSVIQGGNRLLGGLAEAVFMLNMEANADIVKMCSYAPLFENVNQRNWPVNLIWLDSSRVVGRSSYQIQKLFGIHRPDVVLHTEVHADPVVLEHVPAGRRRPGAPQNQPDEPDRFTQVQQIYALGGLDEDRNELIVKIVNPTTEPVIARIVLKGLTDIGSAARIISVAHKDYNAENSLDQPETVVPEESTMTVGGAEFEADIEPNSVTILRMHANG